MESHLWARTQKWVAGNWAAVVLLAGCIFQAAYLLRSPTVGLIREVWQTRGLSALDRSAYFGFGSDFEGYMAFLRANVPPDALIVLPPLDVDYAMGNQGIMQHFLIPRRMVNCPSVDQAEACLAPLTGPDTYILAVGGFPPSAVALRTKEYLPFSKTLGLYVPRPQGSEPVPGE